MERFINNVNQELKKFPKFLNLSAFRRRLFTLFSLNHEPSKSQESLMENCIVARGVETLRATSLRK